jgi:hypothetical protein
MHACIECGQAPALPCKHSKALNEKVWDRKMAGETAHAPHQIDSIDTRQRSSMI